MKNSEHLWAALFIIRAEKNQDYVILPDSVTLSGNTFTLTFTVPAGGWVEDNKDISKNLYIYYHTILKPEAMQEALDAALAARDVKAIFQCFAADPLTTCTLAEAKALFREMVQNTANYLTDYDLTGL